MPVNETAQVVADEALRKPSQRAGANADGNAGTNGRTLLSADDWVRVGQELGLSPRELQVVQHVFAGKKLQAVAGDMRLSLGTVKTYCQRIHQKLEISDQRELVLAVLDSHLQITNPF